MVNEKMSKREDGSEMVNEQMLKNGEKMLEKNCKTCRYALLDETWGEYKCRKKQRKVYDPEEENNCVYYKSNIKKGEKE